MGTRAASVTLAPRLGILADAVLVLTGTGLVAGAAQILLPGVWRIVERVKRVT